MDFFAENFKNMKERLVVLQSSIQDFLNIDSQKLSEKQINYELDEIIKQVLSIDIRGIPVDMLLLIKEKRDQYILKLVEDEYNIESQFTHNYFNIFSNCLAPL